MTSAQLLSVWHLPPSRICFFKNNSKIIALVSGETQVNIRCLPILTPVFVFLLPFFFSITPWPWEHLWLQFHRAPICHRAPDSILVLPGVLLLFWDKWRWPSLLRTTWRWVIVNTSCLFGQQEAAIREFRNLWTIFVLTQSDGERLWRQTHCCGNARPSGMCTVCALWTCKQEMAWMVESALGMWPSHESFSCVNSWAGGRITVGVF